MHSGRALLASLLLCASAWGSGPRFVTGPPFFTGPAGVAVVWKQPKLLYYTDPGSLSTAVNHQQADALVAAAAGVWNLPVASITVAQGGALAEHVSGQNTFLTLSGMVFPDDVMSANAAAIPIAIVYDTDGSVTDTLLGAGASGPTECRQNAVTESVDGFDPAGYIAHAIIVLNGRCTGAAPQLQLDMQYKLERAFGRVLGLAWSQTNDNVFSGTPTPTYDQAMHWPILHPLDIICGSYSYQCLPSPFVLRPDDVASMVALYPVRPNAVPAGKQASWTDAQTADGHVKFPTGEGMAGVNVLVRREYDNTTKTEGWFEASAVTGTVYRRASSSPFVVADTSALGSQGTWDGNSLGYYSIAYVPVLDGASRQNLLTSIEAVNPLYTGALSLGSYALGAVAPSGSVPAAQTTLGVGPNDEATQDFIIGDASGSCGNGADGTAAAPMTLPATGWWTGLICGVGHASYVTANVRPQRSFTLEVTALDAQGLATETKLMPVMGVFAPTDQPGDLPSLNVTPSAFQARGAGTTTISQTTDALTSVRLGIADERGDGRPDYAYQARLFYADNVAPAQLGTAGGTLTIAGTGFRSGNAVTINGVAAKTLSWTANSIVVTAPSMASAHATSGTAVDIVVSDLSTGASSTMTAALTYVNTAALPKTMRLVSAQTANVYVGDAAATPFAVQVIAPDGVTPVAGEAVVFTAPGELASFSACGAGTCTVVTNANGIASTSVTPQAAGIVTMRAADGAMSQPASFLAVAQAGFLKVIEMPTGDLPVGTEAQPPIVLIDYDANWQPLAGRAITFSTTTGSTIFNACAATVCTLTTPANGVIGISLTPNAVGPVTVQIADGDVTQSFSFNAISNADTMRTIIAPQATVYVNSTAGLFLVGLFQADGVTRDYYQQVTFTAPVGVILEPCGTNVCTVSTSYSGQTGVGISVTQAGTYAIVASYGAVTQTVQVTAIEHVLKMVIVSAPSGSVPVGKMPSTPFTAQLLWDGVTPAAGMMVALGGPQGQVILSACGYIRAGCYLFTDGNGMVTTQVTPVTAGMITLSASYEGLNATASFLSAGTVETMRIVTQPPATGTLAGTEVQFAVQVIGPDGVTPAAGKLTVFTVTSGSLGFDSCGSSSCGAFSDGDGMAYASGIPGAAGTITVLASDGTSSALITFTATAKPMQMRLVSAPASGAQVGVAATTPFAVQLLYGDGVSFAAGVNVTLSVTDGSAAFAACNGVATCVVQTNALGVVTSAMTPLSAGSIGLLASAGASVGAARQTASFTAIFTPDVMKLVSAPASGAVVGSAAATPFAVQVFFGDGVSPAAGRSVTLSVTNGSAGLAACGGVASCVVKTDASGMVSTAVTPLSAGTITLAGAEGTAQRTAIFLAVAPKQVLSLASVPVGSVYVGATAASAFSVRVLLADGVTPVAGVAVMFSVDAQSVGGVQFAACGAATCTLTTDAKGAASTSVTGVAAGGVTLVASANLAGGVQAVSAPFQVIANVLSVKAQTGSSYVAEGATLQLALTAVASENGSAVAAQPVHWYAVGGFGLMGSDTVTDATGSTTALATLGPLTAGAQATVTACAWGNVCAAFGGTGVPAKAFQVAIVSGALQSATGGSQLAPVVALVTDGTGHPVAAAAVSVYQTVTALAAPCPAQGRCPAVPVLQSEASVVVSGSDGRVTIQPLAVAGVATQTEVAFSAGTQGFATTILSTQP